MSQPPPQYPPHPYYLSTHPHPQPQPPVQLPTSQSQTQQSPTRPPHPQLSESAHSYFVPPTTRSPPNNSGSVLQTSSPPPIPNQPNSNSNPNQQFSNYPSLQNSASFNLSFLPNPQNLILSNPRIPQPFPNSYDFNLLSQYPGPTSTSSHSTSLNGQDNLFSGGGYSSEGYMGLGMSDGSGFGGSVEGDGISTKESKPAKKTRRREAASCLQCRKKKLRCDRLKPCGNCTKRGESTSCDWKDAQPLYLAQDMNDMADLRSQVDRLQKLVDILTTPGVAESAKEFLTTGMVTALGGTLNGKAEEKVNGEVKEEEGMDLKANDLAEALSYLVIEPILKLDDPAGEKNTQKQNKLIDEARNFCQTLPQSFGLTSDFPNFNVNTSPSSKTTSNSSTLPMSNPNQFEQPTSPNSYSNSLLSRLPYAAPNTTIHDAIRHFPTWEQANSALTYYFSYVDWYLHPCHAPTFHRQLGKLKKDLEAKDYDNVDKFFLAVFLALCGVGLKMMPPNRARRDKFPGDKDKVADSWLEGAMLALTAGKFLNSPSIEAIRALVILNSYFVFMHPGESVNGGITVLTMAVQLALQLGLNRDPGRTEGEFTVLEAEDRRRVFWSLFHLIILSSSSLGRTWMVFDMDNIDVQLPLDIDDDEITPKEIKREAPRGMSFEKETVMTSLLIRMRVAKCATTISKQAFSIKPPTYSEIMELDRQIRKIEDSLPPYYRLKFEGDPDTYWKIVPPSNHITANEMRTYMIYIALAQEYLRIHRPFLVKGSTDSTYKYSREQCLKYSKILLAISRTNPIKSQKWGGLNYKMISAATVVGVELLQNPDGPEADLFREGLEKATAQMKTISEGSSLARRGLKVLQFLHQKDLERSRKLQQPPQAKRTRTEVNQPISSGAAALREAFRTSTQPIVPVEDDTEFRHKSPASADGGESSRRTSNSSGYFRSKGSDGSIPLTSSPARGSYNSQQDGLAFPFFANSLPVDNEALASYLASNPRPAAPLNYQPSQHNGPVLTNPSFDTPAPTNQSINWSDLIGLEAIASQEELNKIIEAASYPIDTSYPNGGKTKDF